MLSARGGTALLYAQTMCLGELLLSIIEITIRRFVLLVLDAVKTISGIILLLTV